MKHSQTITRDDKSTYKLDAQSYKKIFIQETSVLRLAIEQSRLSVREKTQKLQALVRAMSIYDDLAIAPEMSDFIQDKAYDALNEGVVKPTPLQRNFEVRITYITITDVYCINIRILYYKIL